LDGDVAGSSTPPGVDPAHEVELIRHVGLAVLVTPVPLDAFGERSLHEALEDHRSARDPRRVHNEVLREALQKGTVVPFRICTIFESAGGGEGDAWRASAAV